MAYTTQAQIEALLGRSLTSSELVLLPTLLSNADLYINDQLQSSFGSTTPETRYYSGTGTTIIDIDPCHDITKVAGVDRLEVDDNDYIENSDYEAYPRTSPIKRWLEFRGMWLPYGVGNIAVTATFNLGDDVPADISYLAAYLSSNMLQVNNTSLSLKSESIEGYSRTFKDVTSTNFGTDQIVSNILNKYKSDSVIF